MARKSPIRRTVTRLERTAYHEAGHAVAAWHFELPIGTATIRPNKEKDTRGEVVVGNQLNGWQPGDGPRRQLLEERMVVDYAGYATEHVLDGGIGDYEVYGNDAVNPRSMMRIYNLHPPGCQSEFDEATIAPYEKRLRRRAFKLMKEFFPNVEKVKELLLARPNGQSCRDSCGAR